MARLQLNYKSSVLQRTINISCYLPNDTAGYNGVKGVITLLHGIHGCSDDWFNYTACQRYAADNCLALVSPSCDNSFYADMAFGGKYFTFLKDELPKIRTQVLNLPAEKEKNFVFGLSMGGYGAFLLSLSCPQSYAACASFSGALETPKLAEMRDNPLVQNTFMPIFGAQLQVDEQYNLHTLAAKAALLPADLQPKMLATCGAQDNEGYFILMQNQEFAKFMQTMPLNFVYEQWQGVHSWAFWERSLVRAIDLFIAPGYLAQKQNQWVTPIDENKLN